MVDYQKWLQQQAQAMGIALEAVALDQLDQYRRLLQEWNERVNLTTITSTPEIYELHFLDSLSIALVVDMEQGPSLVDVGTGGGFPGLVLAIAFPQARITLVESIGKKAQFLRTVVEELGLQERVRVMVERAEVVGQQPQWREQFDVAVARAVARLAVLAEYCLPLVKVGGYFVAQKGPDMGSELEEALSGIAILGGGETKTRVWTLPSGAARTLVCIGKGQITPSKYPRRPGIPAKRPLL